MDRGLTLVSDTAVKPAEGEPPHLNLRVYDVRSGQEIAGFSQKSIDNWSVRARLAGSAPELDEHPFPATRHLQYTADESKAIRCVTNEVHVYNPRDWSAGIVDKVRLEGVTSVSLSPGQNPNIAMFVAEKKVRPGKVTARIH